MIPSNMATRGNATKLKKLANSFYSALGQHIQQAAEDISNFDYTQVSRLSLEDDNERQAIELMYLAKEFIEAMRHAGNFSFVFLDEDFQDPSSIIAVFVHYMAMLDQLEKTYSDKLLDLYERVDFEELEETFATYINGLGEISIQALDILGDAIDETNETLSKM